MLGTVYRLCIVDALQGTLKCGALFRLIQDAPKTWGISFVVSDDSKSWDDERELSPVTQSVCGLGPTVPSALVAVLSVFAGFELPGRTETTNIQT